jgi:hypothetical protein
LPYPSPFSNAAFPRPRDDAVASLCAAANNNRARKHKDNNNDNKNYAWGGEGHCCDHLGITELEKIGIKLFE